MPKRIYSFANYFWYAAGTGLMLLAPLAITVILNRIGSPEDVGAYSFAYAVTAPMQAFFGIHARTFIAMDRLYGHEPVDVAAQRFHMMAGLFLGAGIVAMFRGFDAQEVAVLASMCLVRTAEGLAEVSAGVMQRQHRPEIIAAAYGVRAIATIAVFAWLYSAGWKLAPALTVMAATRLAIFVLLDQPILKMIGAPMPVSAIVRSLRSRRPLRLFRHLMPAALLILLSVVETNLPRYVVEGATGLVVLGIFTSLTFILYAVTNIIVPVYQMTIAPLGQWAARADAEAARHATHVVFVNVMISAVTGTALVVGAHFVGTRIAVWGLGPHYAGQGPLLIALSVCAAIGLLRSCLGFVLTGLDAITALSLMSVANMALFGVLVYAGSGGTGVVGIAWDWAIASAVTATAGLLIAAGRLVRLHRGTPLVAGMQKVQAVEG
jgi:O-antigen/teichoic acid export membrane protein